MKLPIPTPQARKRLSLRQIVKNRLNAYITKVIDSATIGRPMRG